MSGYVRTKQERERDLVLIAQLYLRGYTMNEITERLNSERPYSLVMTTISRDIKELYERWRNSQLVSFEARQAKELAKIDRLEIAYWEAWDRSIKDREEVFDQVVEDTVNGNPDAYKRLKKETKRFLRDGSVDFLKGVERCIDQRCKILGLYAPDRVQVDWRTQAVQAGVDINAVQQQFEDMVNEFTRAAALDTGHDGRGDSDSEEAS